MLATTKPIGSIDDAFRIEACKALGDIGQATIGQLNALYEALEHVEGAWTGIANQPRTAWDGCDERAAQICDDESTRTFHMRQQIVREVALRRAEPGSSDARDQEIILTRWAHHTSGHEDWRQTPTEGGKP